jgi:hypothetical protein
MSYKFAEFHEVYYYSKVSYATEIENGKVFGCTVQKVNIQCCNGMYSILPLFLHITASTRPQQTPLNSLQKGV